MHADNRRVDHLQGGVMSAGQCAHDPGPDARSSPANEAIVTSGVVTEVVRQVAPWRPRSQDPEDAIEDTTVIHPCTPRGLFGSIGLPFLVGEFVAHDSAPSVRGLNHGSAVGLNMPGRRAFWSTMHPKADPLIGHDPDPT